MRSGSQGTLKPYMYVYIYIYMTGIYIYIYILYMYIGGISYDYHIAHYVAHDITGAMIPACQGSVERAVEFLSA